MYEKRKEKEEQIKRKPMKQKLLSKTIITCNPQTYELFPRLMNNCVVRVSGPAVANETVPMVLLRITGSSLMVELTHCAEMDGRPLIPN